MGEIQIKFFSLCTDFIQGVDVQSYFIKPRSGAFIFVFILPSAFGWKKMKQSWKKKYTFQHSAFAGSSSIYPFSVFKICFNFMTYPIQISLNLTWVLILIIITIITTSFVSYIETFVLNWACLMGTCVSCVQSASFKSICLSFIIQNFLSLCSPVS